MLCNFSEGSKMMLAWWHVPWCTWVVYIGFLSHQWTCLQHKGGSRKCGYEGKFLTFYCYICWPTLLFIITPLLGLEWHSAFSVPFIPTLPAFYVCLCVAFDCSQGILIGFQLVLPDFQSLKLINQCSNYMVWLLFDLGMHHRHWWVGGMIWGVFWGWKWSSCCHECSIHSC